jgi:hypothetical protein
MLGNVILGVCAVVQSVLLISGADPGYVKPGEPAVLACPLQAATSIRWYKPDKTVVKDNEDKHKPNATAHTLEITSVGEVDIGVYQCEDAVTNTSKTNVELKTQPYIVRLPKSSNRVVDQTEVISCTAWGYPTPIISWFKVIEKEGLEEKLSGDGVKYNITITQSGDYHRKSNLTIHNLTHEDKASYMCSVSLEDQMFRTNSSMILRVKDKLAPLWPFIGVCVEILVLVIIIVVYEKRKSKQNLEDEAKEKADFQSNANDHKGEENVRFRK